jgi:hypothetical protein
MNATRVIDEARGFLNALRLQCPAETTMWINIFPMHGDFEASVTWYINKICADFECTAKRYVSYKELQEIITRSIFNKIVSTQSEQVSKMLNWQFIEYYSLASTVENESNPFNPLVSEKTVLIELSSNEYEIEACFITPVGKNIVVATLGHVT